MALSGSWGNGKTSLLNMVREALSGDDIPVTTFNPWLFSSASELAPRFFADVGAQLADAASRFTWARSVSSRILRLGGAAAPLVPIPFVGALGAEVAKQAAERLEAQPSLRVEFEKLAEALAASPQHLVILLDDIDRLTPLEIREMMRLTRLIGGLPNIVLVLAFDRIRVAEALSTDGVNGNEYLEKMIQVTFDLPAIRETILSSELSQELDQAISDYEVRDINKEHWGEVFYRIVKPTIRTLRDAKRLSNNLRVSMAIIGTEIDLADLIGLEAVRSQRPDLMEDLRSASLDLTRVPQAWGSRDYEGEEIATRLKELVDRHQANSRPAIGDVLEVLFPFSNSYLGRTAYGANWESTFRKDRRVAASEVFQIYLSYGLDDGDVPTVLVERALATMANPTEFASLLDMPGLNLQGLMERLEDYEHDYPTGVVESATPVILERLRTMANTSPGLFDFSPRLSGTRVILRLLRRIDSPGDLGESVRRMISELRTLSAKRTLIEMVGHRENIGHRLVTEEVAREFEQALAREVEAATADELATDWDLARLYFRTREWAPEAITRLAPRWIESDTFVVALINSALGETKSTSGRVLKREQRLPWAAFEAEFGTDEWRAAATRESVLGLLGVDLRELVERYASGWKPEDNF